MNLRLAALAAAITISSTPVLAWAEAQPLPGAPTAVDAVTLTATGDSAASGSAWIIAGPDDQHVIVTAVVRGLQPGSSQSARLRRGTCQAESGAAYPLNDMVATDEGIATASTVLPVAFQNITPGSFALDVGSSCGNITVDSVQMIGNALQFQQMLMEQMQQMFQNAPPGLLNP